jgi:peptide/nickel transport system substrate-binding protein
MGRSTGGSCRSPTSFRRYGGTATWWWRSWAFGSACYVSTNLYRPFNDGWHLYLNAICGVDGVDPMNKLIRANGETVSNRWANIPEVEVEVDAWYDAISFEAEAAGVRRSNKVALDNVVYAPLGSYLRHFAWRKGGTGVVQGPLSFFWGVSRSA